ncbi:membrane protein, partial [Candidatus Omnitrophus magneticus]
MKPKSEDILILTIALFVLISFNHVNFRNDATYYIKRIKDAYYTENVEFNNYELKLGDDGKIKRERRIFFIQDRKPYFNYLSLPIKFYKFDFRYTWFIYTKIFAFLSILAVFVLASNLIGPQFAF